MDYSLKEDIIERAFEKIKHFILPSENNNYKSRFLQSNVLLYCVVLILALKIVAILVSINIPQNIFFADITKSVLENSVNQTRQSLGLQPLSENQKLDEAAQLKAENMVQDEYFNHVSPSGVTPWAWFLKAGYNYKYAGENLAIGFYDSQEVYDAWLNSPSHKANIVDPNYTEVGTAVLSGFGQDGKTIVVVQEFGSPLPVKQTVATVAKSNNPKPVTIQPNTTVTTAKPASAANTQTPAVNTTAPAANTNTSTPAANTNAQTPTANNNEKVLSQSTELQNSIEPANETGANNLSSKILNSVLYNYDGLLQDIIYGVSSVVMGILLTLILLNFNINFNFKRELVFRAALIIVLLSAATLLNKETIISLIPHQIII
jgi:uncharacterized protein YkwD